MGNLVVFRRETAPVPPNSTSNCPAGSSEGKDLPLASDAELTSVRGGKLASWAVFRRFGLTRFIRGSVKTNTHLDLDGYLLVLLADQELTAGRDQQAQALLDAAYATFDRHAHTQPERAASR